MASKVIVASTTHGKPYRMPGHVFTPTPQRFELSEGEWAEFQRRIEAKAPIVFEEVSLKAAKIDREAKKLIADLRQQIEELTGNLKAVKAAAAEEARAARARIEDLEALLEEATASAPKE